MLKIFFQRGLIRVAGYKVVMIILRKICVYELSGVRILGFIIVKDILSGRSDKSSRVYGGDDYSEENMSCRVLGFKGFMV